MNRSAKLTLVLTMVAASDVASAQSHGYWPRSFNSETGLSNVCIEHPGAWGSANMSPITVVIASHAELTISGESAVCYFADAGTLKISLRFGYPYAGPSERTQSWTTAPISIDAPKDGITLLAICEANQNHNSTNWPTSGWHGMWVLRRFQSGATNPCGAGG
jgi:hypothetical protein